MMTAVLRQHLRRCGGMAALSNIQKDHTPGNTSGYQNRRDWVVGLQAICTEEHAASNRVATVIMQENQRGFMQSERHCQNLIGGKVQHGLIQT